MGRGRRMNDKTLHIGDVCQQGENLQRVDECVRFFLPALDVESKDRTAAVREVFLV